MGEVRWLDEREASAWRAVRDLGQPLWTALGRDLQRDSGLSMADYQVLVVLSAAPEGRLAYRELADATDWEKSRLSHHITRMEQRNLVQREGCAEDGRSANIVITGGGRAAIDRAAPGHVASVRRLLIDRLTSEQVDALAAIGAAVRGALQEDGDGPGAGSIACPVDDRAAGRDATGLGSEDSRERSSTV